MFEFLTDECVSDDEVVHSKRLGNKVLVDLYRSNPLIVIWDTLVGQKFKHFDLIWCNYLSRFAEKQRYACQATPLLKNNWTW